ncbi:transcriptional regulator, LuxR family [Sphingomonas gellani]|uniref:Transcriptional regulator, LuxR family n=2 Tax=Sphingomonas gellani TaxID=1166340 RepID=A0A1H8CPL2_9SPHN|nr:PAS domain S-box protein [Sphingomonas gellani]SEM97191.1 transcriptional regulator, LuxR family [Sphingomonas gellani]
MAQLLDGVIVMDPTGVILTANAAALRMHGVGSVAGLGATAEDYADRFSLRDGNDRPLKHRDYPLFRLLAGEGYPDLIVKVAPAGEDETRWVHQVRDVTMDEDGGEPDFLALVMSDVSARFDAEARFDAMFRANPAPALVIRLSDQRVARANPGFLDLTGFREEQLTGRTLFALDLLQGMKAPADVRHRIEAGEVGPQMEAELLTADGARRLVLFAGQPIDVTDEDALLLTFADLEPRRQAQDALAAGERHLATLLDMAPIAIAVTADTDGRITRVNAAFAELSGRADAVGRTMDQLALWADAERGRVASQEIATTGSMRGLDAQLMTADGKPIDCLLSAERIDLHGAPCTLWLFQDITERRRGELDLIQAIDATLQDASWLSRSIMDRLATVRRGASSAPAADLSAREREILELICTDLDDAAIAERLGLSRNTVRNHVARLYAKIGVNRRSAAVIWGRDRGIGSPQDTLPVP